MIFSRNIYGSDRCNSRMSAGYNSGLSEYPNKGKLNLIESEDPKDVLQSKVDQLVKLIEQAKSIVFHTGAGISTSTGIPDFRGPKGVWTLESQVNIYKVGASSQWSSSQ